MIDSIDPDGTMTERSLESHIHQLRQKIEPDPHMPAYVITVQRLGYRLQVTE